MDRRTARLLESLDLLLRELTSNAIDQRDDIKAVASNVSEGRADIIQLHQHVVELRTAIASVLAEVRKDDSATTKGLQLFGKLPVWAQVVVLTALAASGWVPRLFGL